METVEDYIDAYSEISMKQANFEKTFDAYASALSLVEARRKGFLDLANDGKAGSTATTRTEVLRAVIDLTRRQIKAMKDIQTLPQEDWVDSWNERFYPLLVEQDELREKLNAIDERPSEADRRD